MYVPAANRWEDVPGMHAFMRDHNFATVVSWSGEIAVTHIPVIVDDSDPGLGTLRGHVARANAHGLRVAGGESTMFIFQGPHAYISPRWYASSPNVPTWNYAVVHATGCGRELAAEDLRAHLREIVAFHDPEAPPVPEEFFEKMMRGVVGFEVTIERLEGKLKMSQNKTEADRAMAIDGLSGSEDPVARATARIMHSLLENGQS
jgi:transcriptional regulator